MNANRQRSFQSPGGHSGQTVGGIAHRIPHTTFSRMIRAYKAGSDQVLSDRAAEEVVRDLAAGQLWGRAGVRNADKFRVHSPAWRRKGSKAAHVGVRGSFRGGT